MEKVLKLVAEIEKARREKRYEAMETAVVAFHVALGDDESSEAWKARAKVGYERHMAGWQKYKDSSDPMFLNGSRLLAEQSSMDAKRANDVAGELFPQMNIGGHILPALDQWEEGVTVLKATLEKAESLASTALPGDALRFSRIAMNCYLFLIDIAITHEGDSHEVRLLLKAVEANPVFQTECKGNEVWGREWRDRALKYIASSS